MIRTKRLAKALSSASKARPLFERTYTDLRKARAAFREQLWLQWGAMRSGKKRDQLWDQMIEEGYACGLWSSKATNGCRDTREHALIRHMYYRDRGGRYSETYGEWYAWLLKKGLNSKTLKSCSRKNNPALQEHLRCEQIKAG